MKPCRYHGDELKLLVIADRARTAAIAAVIGRRGPAPTGPIGSTAPETSGRLQDEPGLVAVGLALW